MDYTNIKFVKESLEATKKNLILQTATLEDMNEQPESFKPDDYEAVTYLITTLDSQKQMLETILELLKVKEPSDFYHEMGNGLQNLGCLLNQLERTQLNTTQLDIIFRMGLELERVNINYIHAQKYFTTK